MITVGIPTFNRPIQLCRTLATLRENLHNVAGDIEVHILDTGTENRKELWPVDYSEDIGNLRSEDIVRQFAKSVEVPVIYERASSTGWQDQSAYLNYLLKASGEFFILHLCDTLYLDSLGLKTLLDKLAEDVFLYTELYVVRETFKLHNGLPAQDYIAIGKEAVASGKLEEYGVVSFPTTESPIQAFSREAGLSIGGWDETFPVALTYGRDFVARMQRSGIQLKASPVKVLHQKHLETWFFSEKKVEQAHSVLPERERTEQVLVNQGRDIGQIKVLERVEYNCGS